MSAINSDTLNWGQVLVQFHWSETQVQQISTRGSDPLVISSDGRNLSEKFLTPPPTAVQNTFWNAAPGGTEDPKEQQKWRVRGLQLGGANQQNCSTIHRNILVDPSPHQFRYKRQTTLPGGGGEWWGVGEVIFLMLRDQGFPFLSSKKSDFRP